MDTRTKEAVRYLGYGRHAVDDSTLALIKESFDDLDQIAGKRIICRIFDVSFLEADCLEIGTLYIKSKSLGKNMKGCEKAVVSGATLGVEVDMYMRKLSITDMAKTVVMQACAAAVLEEYLEECQEQIRCDMREEGLYPRPRFSPGYGDFSIEHQGAVLRMLDAPKRIGLTMTDSGMLSPTKSVTAVTGLGRTQERCHAKGCGACGKTDCRYRR